MAQSLDLPQELSPRSGLSNDTELELLDQHWGQLVSTLRDVRAEAHRSKVEARAARVEVESAKAEIERLQEAGCRLQAAYEEAQKELRDAVGDAAYWRVLLEESEKENAVLHQQLNSLSSDTSGAARFQDDKSAGRVHADCAAPLSSRRSAGRSPTLRGNVNSSNGAWVSLRTAARNETFEAARAEALHWFQVAKRREEEIRRMKQLLTASQEKAERSCSLETVVETTSPVSPSDELSDFAKEFAQVKEDENWRSILPNNCTAERKKESCQTSIEDVPFSARSESRKASRRALQSYTDRRIGRTVGQCMQANGPMPQYFDIASPQISLDRTGRSRSFQGVTERSRKPLTHRSAPVRSASQPGMSGSPGKVAKTTSSEPQLKQRVSSSDKEQVHPQFCNTAYSGSKTHRPALQELHVA